MWICSIAVSLLVVPTLLITLTLPKLKTLLKIVPNPKNTTDSKKVI